MLSKIGHGFLELREFIFGEGAVGVKIQKPKDLLWIACRLCARGLVGKRDRQTCCGIEL